MSDSPPEELDHLPELPVVRVAVEQGHGVAAIVLDEVRVTVHGHELRVALKVGPEVPRSSDAIAT